MGLEVLQTDCTKQLCTGAAGIEAASDLMKANIARKEAAEGRLVMSD